MPLSYDRLLDQFSELAWKQFGEECFETNTILRDAFGSLTLILKGNFESETRKRFDRDVAENLSKYIDLPSATPSELFQPELCERSGLLEPVCVDGEERLVPVLSQNIVGSDWNSPNFDFSTKAEVLTFFSCKGGVGRSTALAIVASHLSSQGKRVLVLDLDIEAPGIGEILLSDNERPEYGILDFLTEQNFEEPSDAFLRDCIGVSDLTDGNGLIEVVPAAGRSTYEHPGTLLSKISFALTEREDNDGNKFSFLAKIQSLVSRLSDAREPDYILVDARAGLSETTAAAILGLGGGVLMFGVDTPQTFECYRYLFAHLQKFLLSHNDTSWRENMRMVHAQARPGAEAREKFRDRTHAVFADFLYEEADVEELDAFNFDIDDDNAPHFAWPIPYDANFIEFDPKEKKDQLSKEFIDRTFGVFLEGVQNMLGGGRERKNV